MEEKRPFAEADQSAVGCSHGRWQYTQGQMSARVRVLPPFLTVPETPPCALVPVGESVLWANSRNVRHPTSQAQRGVRFRLGSRIGTSTSTPAQPARKTAAILAVLPLSFLPAEE